MAKKSNFILDFVLPRKKFSYIKLHLQGNVACTLSAIIDLVTLEPKAV